MTYCFTKCGHRLWPRRRRHRRCCYAETERQLNSIILIWHCFSISVWALIKCHTSSFIICWWRQMIAEKRFLATHLCVVPYTQSHGNASRKKINWWINFNIQSPFQTLIATQILTACLCSYGYYFFSVLLHIFCLNFIFLFFDEFFISVHPRMWHSKCALPFSFSLLALLSFYDCARSQEPHMFLLQIDAIESLEILVCCMQYFA